MTEIFTLKQELTWREFISAIFNILFNLKATKQILLVLLGFCLVNSTLNLTAPGKETRWYFIILASCALPLFFFTFFTVAITLVASLFMIARPQLYKNNTLRFTHWGMEKTGKGFEVTLPWSKFIKFRETNNFILLYTTEKDAEVIQKRMFRDASQLDEFKNFISEYLKRD